MSSGSEVNAERAALVAVPVGKVRPGDMIALCDGIEPDVEVASIEYVGCRTGLAEHVEVAFMGEDGPYLMQRGAADKPGRWIGYDHFYALPEVADEIEARPGAMDAFYEQDGENS